MKRATRSWFLPNTGLKPTSLPLMISVCMLNGIQSMKVVPNSALRLYCSSLVKYL